MEGTPPESTGYMASRYARRPQMGLLSCTALPARTRLVLVSPARGGGCQRQVLGLTLILHDSLDRQRFNEWPQVSLQQVGRSAQARHVHPLSVCLQQEHGGRRWLLQGLKSLNT